MAMPICCASGSTEQRAISGRRGRPQAEWAPGTVIVQQEIWKGRLWSARPMRVVEDRGDGLVLWCPRGTRWKTATTPPTRSRAATRAERFALSLSLCDWVLGDFVWDVSTLVLVREGDWHATWVSWGETGESWGWYVNFQRPFVRTKAGIQTMDLMLDILVPPDRRWRWKDEDEFHFLVSRDIIGTNEATQVREEARRVIDQIERNLPPFNRPWHDWRPDSSWPVPGLVGG